MRTGRIYRSSVSKRLAVQDPEGLVGQRLIVQLNLVAKFVERAVIRLWRQDLRIIVADRPTR